MHLVTAYRADISSPRLLLEYEERDSLGISAKYFQVTNNCTQSAMHLDKIKFTSPNPAPNLYFEETLYRCSNEFIYSLLTYPQVQPGPVHCFLT